MFKKIRFFNRFKKLVFGGFAILCGAITCCLLGSWTSNNGIYESDYLKKNTTYFGNGAYVTKNSETSNNYYNTLNLTWDWTEIDDSMITTDNLNISYGSYYILIEENTNQIGGGALLVDLTLANGHIIYGSTYQYDNRVGELYDIIEGNYILIYGTGAINYISLYYSGDYLRAVDYIPNTETIDYKITITRNQPYVTMFRDTNLIQADTYEDVQSWYYDNGTEEFISKNLLDELNLTDGVYITSDGYFYTTTNNYYGMNLNTFISLDSDSTYSISMNVSNLIAPAGNNFVNVIVATWNNDNFIERIVERMNVSNNIASAHFTTSVNTTKGYIYFYTANTDTILSDECSNIMLNGGSKFLPFLPYGIIYSEEQYNNLEDDYVYYQNKYIEEKNRADEYETLYNDLLGTKTIDYDNYKIYYVNYGTAQTTENYTIIGEVDVRDYVSNQGFLDISDIRNITGFGDTWDGIVIESENYLNLYNYNLLFNGSGSANLDFALYYKYFDVDSFSVLSLSNIVGDSAYYGYFDLISLFGRNNIATNFQNMLYNKFALHWTGIPSDTDLVNIKLNSADGYNSGYAQGQADQFYNYEELQEDYNELNNQYNSLESTYNQLHERYEDLANTDLGFSMSKLMWNIASTPFESFKSIWSVNFLDFNIASFITGILSIFVIVWLLKKIF